MTQFALKTVRPHVLAIVRIDQLNGNDEVLADFLLRTIKDQVGTQCLTDILNAEVPILEFEARVARYCLESGIAGKVGQDALAYGITQIALVGSGALVVKT